MVKVIVVRMMSAVASLYELCHGKTYLKIFILVISEKGLAGRALYANLSLGMTPTMKL